MLSVFLQVAITLSSVCKNAHTYTHEYIWTCVYTQEYTLLRPYAYRHTHKSGVAAPSAAQTHTGDCTCATVKHDTESWGGFGAGLEKVMQWPKNQVPHLVHVFFSLKIWDASQICMSSWCKNQDNLCTVLILVLGLSTLALVFKQTLLEGEVDATLVALLKFSAGFLLTVSTWQWSWREEWMPLGLVILEP